MQALEIELPDGRTAYSPGETLSGNAIWRLQDKPKEVMLQLVWQTQGKGSTDMDIAETIPFANPQASESRPFSIRLPDAPYTFSGQLISLIWNLELNIQPGDQSHALEIAIAPHGKEILLPRIQPVKK